MDPGKRQDPERHSEGPPMSVRQATDLVPPEKKTTKIAWSLIMEQFESY